MKKDNKGFMLAETLIITTFVCGVLIFLYIQFSKLNSGFADSYIYNTVEGLYALEDVKSYIESDEQVFQYINDTIGDSTYIDLTDCNLFIDKTYCLKLMKLENIKYVIVTKNSESYDSIKTLDEEFNSFISRINKEGQESYSLIAAFNNSTYATLRFGDENEK